MKKNILFTVSIIFILCIIGITLYFSYFKNFVNVLSQNLDENLNIIEENNLISNGHPIYVSSSENTSILKDESFLLGLDVSQYNFLLSNSVEKAVDTKAFEDFILKNNISYVYIRLRR